MIPRLIQKPLLNALKGSPVVFLNGARQSGKSTLVQNHLAEIGKGGLEAVYITFDNMTQAAAAASSPETFLSIYTKGCFLAIIKQIFLEIVNLIIVLICLSLNLIKTLYEIKLPNFKGIRIVGQCIIFCH